MNVKQLSAVKIECVSKPKLRTFIKFKDFHNRAPHIGKPLSFLERKLISQLEWVSCHLGLKLQGI